jgi:peroxiredoxin (alkyl hydroperoxide reductase subunit C)
MSIQVGSTAPSFSAPALVGREFKDITLKELLDDGKWVVLFFYPKDFTFVCPTEIVGFNDMVEEFADRNTVVLGASTDTVNSHLGWVRSDERLQGLRYPLLGDVTKRITRDFGVLLEDQGIALRGTFIIDPTGRVRWSSIYDLDIGRNIEEVVRVLDALQSGGLCACGWREGDEHLRPSG